MVRDIRLPIIIFRLDNSRPPIVEAQERNDRALAVLNRVQHKLTGS
jgi:hypothetical protein